VTSTTHKHKEGRGLLAPMTALPQDEDVNDDDPRRVEIREWLEQHPHPSGSDLAQAGLVAPHWPPPWGRGANVEDQLIIDDELGRAHVQRPSIPLALAGPDRQSFRAAR
jgi:alkylation response protein AidB-like acyl-CoA dehydrogenase